MKDVVAAKYLANYAEKEARATQALGKTWKSAVVIPAFAETDAFVRRLLSMKQDSPRLVIVVVNARDDASPESLEQNEALMAFIRGLGAATEIGEAVTLIETPSDSELDWVLIDATSVERRLLLKEGVGRARKKGLDWALAAHMQGALRAPMVGSTDADAHLPEGYFSALENASSQEAALLFPYRHLPAPDPQLREAMKWVEMSFRYYVCGLAYACSPYAYHSLGSALAVNLFHYARVRGVPNRQAGEDFYLLSKLSKLGPLRRLSESTVEIETRVSDRVPFGTGPSLQKALDQGGELSAYHPDAFEFLKSYLHTITNAALDPAKPPALDPGVPAWVQLEARRTIDAASPHWTACPTPEHRQRRIHERVDALTTLQFIHRAHREGLPMVPITHALAQARFINCSDQPMRMAAELSTQEGSLSDLVGLKP